MTATSQNAPQDRVSAAQPKLRLRYGRLSVALLGLLAVVATVATALVAPFTSLGFGWVLFCLAVAAGSFAALRALAVRDRNRRMMNRWEQVRREALGPVQVAEPSNRAATVARRDEKVFDARPDSGRRAPSVTAEELRAEALRVARGAGGVQQPATWEPTEVPKPKYVTAREATEQIREQVAKQVRPEPLPKAEPLRPSSKISLKAAEEAKQIANQVSADQKAAVAKLERTGEAEAAEKTGLQAPAAPAADVAAEKEAPAAKKEPGGEPSRTRLNLDAVMQRRRA